MRTANDHLVTLPCAYARQRSHVAVTCDSQGGDVHAGKLFAVRACGRRTAKAMVRRTARLAARQRKTHGSAATHGNVLHTAMGKDAWQRSMARQRCLTHGKEVNAWQRALPCGAGKTHGKESVAGQYIAVRSWPCIDARQSLCLAFSPLYRAFCPHGKALFSGRPQLYRKRK
jgi:hypothetical protein